MAWRPARRSGQGAGEKQPSLKLGMLKSKVEKRYCTARTEPQGRGPASVSGSAHQSQGLAQNDEAQARWLTWTSLTGVGRIEAATLQPDTRSL